MSTTMGPRRRRAERGSSAVEMLLSITFLAAFGLMVLDFARGFAAQTRTQVAARHIAWANGRAYEYVYDALYESSHPHHHAAAPDEATIAALHFAGRGGTVSAPPGNQKTYNVASAFDPQQSVQNATQGASDDKGVVGKLLGALNDLLGRRVISWSTGFIDGWQGTVTQDVAGIRLFGGGQARAVHFVAFYAAPEHSPSKRWGWFDFLEMAANWVKEAFD